jgi:hypothetical protein
METVMQLLPQLRKHASLYLTHFYEIITGATVLYDATPHSLIAHPPKRRHTSNRLHGVTLQNNVISMAPILLKTISETLGKGTKSEKVAAVTIKITRRAIS